MNLDDRVQTGWLMRPIRMVCLLSLAYLNLFQLFSSLAPAACAFLLLQALPTTVWMFLINNHGVWANRTRLSLLARHSPK